MTGFDAAAGALQRILDKYTPGYHPQGITSRLVEKYRSAMDGNAVAVYRVTPIKITMKENAEPPEALFGFDAG